MSDIYSFSGPAPSLYVMQARFAFLPFGAEFFLFFFVFFFVVVVVFFFFFQAEDGIRDKAT